MFLDLVGGLATVGDNPATVDWINTYIDALVDAVAPTLSPSIKQDFHVDASRYWMWGESASRTNRFGPNGNLDFNIDAIDNLTEYNTAGGDAPATREPFLMGLNITPPIRIVTHPGSITGLSGDTFSIGVTTIGGSGTFTYAWENAAGFPGDSEASDWLFGLEPISYGNGILGQGTATLSFDYLLLAHDGWAPWVRISDNTTIYNDPWTPGDDGSIETAENPATWAVSGGTGGRTSHTGNVIATTRAFQVTTNTVSGVQPEWIDDYFSTAFSVTGDGNTLAPTFHWYRDGIEVFTGGNIVITSDWHTSTLEIINIQVADIIADWHCEAVSDGLLMSNTFGFGICCVPPTITLDPVGANKAVGGLHTFVVDATGGTPPYCYEWYRNTLGGAAGAGTAVGGNASLLTLDPLADTDQGTYSCVVDGAVSATADLRVLAIATQPLSQTIGEGSPVTFSVEVLAGSGNAPYTYQWLKDDVNIGGATSSNYTIGAVAPGDAGNYTCLVGQTSGTSLISATATLIGGGIWYVDVDNVAGPWDGTSWATALYFDKFFFMDP